VKEIAVLLYREGGERRKRRGAILGVEAGDNVSLRGANIKGGGVDRGKKFG